MLETPLVRAPWLEELTGGSRAVRLKLESAQRGGSYKARGATHFARGLSDEHLARGVVTAAGGAGGAGGDASNLGAALARAVIAERRRRGIRGAGAPARVYVRRSAQGTKDGISSPPLHNRTEKEEEEEEEERSAEEIVEVAEAEAETNLSGSLFPSSSRRGLLSLSFSPPTSEARAAASLSGSPFVHPYGDVRLLGGHGGMALELLSRTTPDDLDVVYLPVGGGSLLAATAAVLKTLAPGVRVVACAAEGAQGALEDTLETRETHRGDANCLKKSSKELDDQADRVDAAGAVSPSGDSVADASTTLALSSCARYVDEWLAVPERAVAKAMTLAMTRGGIRVEAGGALALAGAMLAEEGRNAGRAVVVVVSGGNVDEETLRLAEDIARGA